MRFEGACGRNISSALDAAAGAVRHVLRCSGLLGSWYGAARAVHLVSHRRCCAGGGALLVPCCWCCAAGAALPVLRCRCSAAGNMLVPWCCAVGAMVLVPLLLLVLCCWCLAYAGRHGSLVWHAARVFASFALSRVVDEKLPVAMGLHDARGTTVEIGILRRVGPRHLPTRRTSPTRRAPTPCTTLYDASYIPDASGPDALYDTVRRVVQCLKQHSAPPPLLSNTLPPPPLS